MARRCVRLCCARAGARRRRRRDRARLQEADQAPSSGPRRRRRRARRGDQPRLSRACGGGNRGAEPLHHEVPTSRQAPGDALGPRDYGAGSLLAVLLLAAGPVIGLGPDSLRRARPAGRMADCVPAPVPTARWTEPLHHRRSIDAARAAAALFRRRATRWRWLSRQPRLPPRASRRARASTSSTAARRSTMRWSSCRTAIRCATRGRSASLR